MTESLGGTTKEMICYLKMIILSVLYYINPDIIPL